MVCTAEQDITLPLELSSRHREIHHLEVSCRGVVSAPAGVQESRGPEKFTSTITCERSASGTGRGWAVASPFQTEGGISGQVWKRESS